VIVACLDLEGVLVPKSGSTSPSAPGSRSCAATTRDEPDYDRLMRRRLEILDRHKLGIREIEAVIATLRSAARRARVRRVAAPRASRC